MNFSAALLVWFAFVVPGLAFSGLSLRRAWFVLLSVRGRHALADVVDDARHVARCGLLLLLGWLVFFGVGVLGLLATPSAPPAPRTATDDLILWGLLAAVGIWAVMTANDDRYTRRVWRRTPKERN